ncbi:unnamed protein product [Caenorhabditis angaria]|uniref:Uncharacterized protein n=1 Tax=Caenorhabditis angaria TaxID=860376 RepID=A0A9P1IWN3_9PELO|nr:unnamed protein product [Caenorhabditis angaria]
MFWISIILLNFSNANIDVKKEAEQVLDVFRKSIHEKNQILFVQIVSPSFKIEQCDLTKKRLNRADLYNEITRYNLDVLPMSKIDYNSESVTFDHTGTITQHLRA